MQYLFNFAPFCMEESWRERYSSNESRFSFHFIDERRFFFFPSLHYTLTHTHTHTRIIHMSPQRDYHVARKKETGREGDRAEVAFKLSGQD